MEFTFRKQKILITSTLAMCFILCSLAALANQPRTVTASVFGPPVPVTVLNPGDKATITGLMVSNDINENGEGEILEITSTGGGISCSSTIAAYFIPTVFDCDTVPANSSGVPIVAAFYPWGDGDELGTVVAQINVKPSANKTPQQINAWQKQARNLDAFALALEAKAAVCRTASGGFKTLFCNSYIERFEDVAIGDKYMAAEDELQAADPPDPNYTQIAQPTTTFFPLAAPVAGLPQSLTDAFNAWLVNKQRQIGLDQAAVISLDRATGAMQAGDIYWQHAQVLAAAKYDYEFGALQKEEPTLMVTLYQELKNAGQELPVDSYSQIGDYEYQVLYNGLPAEQQSLFSVLGMDQDLQKQITGVTYVQNINYISFLDQGTDGSYLFNFYPNNQIEISAGDNFQKFALLNGYSSIDCSKATPSISTIWPPNHKFSDIQIRGVVDGSNEPISIAINSIYQDEPVDIDGSGNTVPDGAGIGSSIAQVRAERSGRGSGRFYFINFKATNTDGNSCLGNVTVNVPHDQNHPAMDSGLKYDSVTGSPVSGG